MIFSRKGTRLKRRERNKIDSDIVSIDVDRQKLIKFFNTTSKCLIWFYSINSALWVWCSYILAWCGREQIAESLSSNVCSVIIGGLGVYLVTKTIENVFKYNDIGGPRSYISSSSESSNSTKILNPVLTNPVKKEEETENVEISQSFN